MRSLILFFIKYSAFFLFLILETFCFYLIVQNNRFQRANFINSANAITGNINNSIQNLLDYFHLKSVNETLSEEIANLKSKKVVFFDTTYNINQVNDSSENRFYTYISAKVINNTVHKTNNYITLNKGLKDGVRMRMGVIGTNGLVGIVKDVSENFSSVMSLLHQNVRISSKLLKNNYFGSLYWDGKYRNRLTFDDIPKHVELNVGDTVVTSGYSSIFPENITIGTISKFYLEKGDNFYTIFITPSVDFQQLSFVYIINNYMKKEQLLIEKKSVENE